MYLETRHLAPLVRISLGLILTAGLFACSATQTTGSSANALAVPLLKGSYADYYSAYQWSWQNQKADIQKNFTNLRLQTFSDYAKTLGTEASSVQIGNLVIHQSADEAAQVQTLFSQLGTKYGTVGAFFDAYNVTLLELSSAQIESALQTLASGSSSKETTGLALDAGSDFQSATKVCDGWLNDVKKSEAQNNITDPAKLISTQMNATAYNQIYSGGSYGTNPNNDFYLKAKTTLTLSGWKSFYSYMSNGCARSSAPSSPSQRTYRDDTSIDEYLNSASSSDGSASS